MELLHIFYSAPLTCNHAGTTRPLYHLHSICVLLASEPANSAATDEQGAVVVAALNASIEAGNSGSVAHLLRFIAAIGKHAISMLHVVLVLGDADGVQLLAVGVELGGIVELCHDNFPFNRFNLVGCFATIIRLSNAKSSSLKSNSPHGLVVG